MWAVAKRKVSTECNRKQENISIKRKSLSITANQEKGNWCYFLQVLKGESSNYIAVMMNMIPKVSGS